MSPLVWIIQITSNMMERLSQEIRRRTRLFGFFPMNPLACGS
jgi:transposase-like protein